MPKGKIKRGRGFRGAVNYDLEKEGATIVGGNMLGTSPAELAHEFGLSRSMRPEVDKPVLHMSLSCPPPERLSDAQWDAISTRFMDLMGLSGHQFLAVRHTDTPHDHIHITSSRIKLDGELWHGQWEVFRMIKATQQIEREFGLQMTPGLEEDPDATPEQAPSNTGKKNPSKEEIEQADRTGEAPVRLRLQEILDDVLDGPQTVLALMDRLDAAGVTARPNLASTGRMNGFSFELDGIAFKASQLGKSYAWKKLQERGVEYEPDRDAEAVRQRGNRPTEASSEIAGREPAGIGAEAGQGGNGRVSDHSTLPIDNGNDGADFPRADSGIDQKDRSSIEADIRRDENDAISVNRDGSVEENAVVAAQEPIPPVLYEAVDLDDLGDDWSDPLDRLADLASSEPERSDLSLQYEPGPVTKSQRVKLDAWAQQHEALGAPLYRVSLMRSDNGEKVGRNLGKGRGADGTEKFYTAQEIADLVPFLSRENLLGWNIYITPIDTAHHYLIVDDMTPDDLDRFDAQGFEPALVLETSPGSHQAILKTEKEDRDQKAANVVVVGLNKKYGDPKFTGAIHPMRLAGFSNKKPGKGSPFTKIKRSVGGVCKLAGSILKQARQSLSEKLSERLLNRKKEVSPQTATSLPEPFPVPRPVPADSQIAKLHDNLRSKEIGLAESKGWEVDQSAIDYRVARQLLIDGWDVDEVSSVIMQRSPGLDERHAKPWDYVNRTVENANSKIKQAERGLMNNVEDESGPGPGL